MPKIALLPQIHLLLAVQTIVIILLSVNRLSRLTLGYVAPNQFLRWVDFNNMLVLPLISLVAFYLLKATLGQTALARADRRGKRTEQAMGLLFVIGIYLFGVGYGVHEVTNYLHTRFCSAELAAASAGPDLCRIVIFTDDEFSHWIWFAGFVLINLVLLLTQAHYPYRGAWRRRDTVCLIANGGFVALGIFANLAFETIGLDLYVVALLALLAAGLWWRLGRQPLFLYYNLAYWLGLVGTAFYQLLR